MRKEYDLKHLKIKRHGLLSALKVASTNDPKMRVTMALNKDAVIPDAYDQQALHQ
ncbi:MAG: hypothetical protein KA508_07125 [Gammaproteobacteria bacterium]|nr:hypothetical protein [Gammaproteobacteria bacterium]